jgi:DNA polymerase-3 subunit beta
VKLLINGGELTSAVPWLARLTNYRIASLGGVMITASERVSLSTTDTDTFATATPPSTVLDEGRALLSARALTAVAKGLGRSEVTITSDGSTAVIERGSSRWTLPEIDATYFPDFPSLSEELGRIPGEVLKEGLRRVLPVLVSKDAPIATACPALTGVEFTLGQGLTLAASDRFRVATVELDWQPTLTAGERTLLVPESLLTFPMSILGTDEVRLHTDGNRIGFVTDRYQVFGRLLDVAFVAWRGTFPKDFITTVTVDTAELLGAVKDAGVFSVVVGREHGDHLRLAFDQDSIEVESCNKLHDRGKDGNGATVISPQGFEGEPISIWCQPHYLTNALSVMPGPTTVLSFGQYPWSPILLTPAEGGYRHLLVPLKIPAALAWNKAREEAA